MNKIIFIFICTCSTASFGDLKLFKSDLQKVLEDNPTVQMQLSNIRISESATLSKKLYWTPSVSALLSRGWAEGSPADIDASAAVVKLNVYKFGSDSKALQSAENDLKKQNVQLSNVKQDLETKVAGIIFQIIRLQNVLEIQKKNLNLKIESQRVATERFRQGQLPSQELSKVKIDVDSSRILVQQAELKLIDAASQLKSIADYNIEETDWPFVGLIDSNLNKKHLDPEKFNQFRYFQLEADSFFDIASATKRAGYLPSLDVQFGWSNSAVLGNINGGQWLSTVSLSIPLWDRLVTASTASGYYENGRISRLQALIQKRQIQQNLNTFQQRLDISRLSARTAMQAAAKLQDLRNDSLRRFRLGRATVNDLLIDEQRFLEAESNVQDLLLNFHQLLVEACHNAGESLLNCY